MKFIYLTAKRYPGNTADHNYVLNLAKSFYSKLGNDFRFVVCNTQTNDLSGLPIVNVIIPNYVKRTAYYFYWFPRFWFTLTMTEQKNFDDKKDGKEQFIFFSNDQNLLSVLLIWRKLFGLPFQVVADWHLLTNTWKDRFIAKRVDCSIVTSNKLGIAVANLSPKSKIRTVYGGIDLNFFKQTCDTSISEEKSSELLRESLDLPTGKFLIGYVGLFKTLGQEKGIRTMIESLLHLDSNNIMVFVGGKTGEISEYKKYSEDIKVSDRCIFLPILPFGKVVQYEKAMNVLVIPYPDLPHFRNFGFPMKVYEYMASKVPIVYSKLELLEEVIEDCAFGIKPDDSEDLATKIFEIKSDPEEANRKALLAYKKVQKYSWEDKATEIINHLL